jgi:hypothetical protein
MSALSLNQYNSLDELDQLQVLEDEGVVVATRFMGKQHIYLFQLFSFYVEIHYQSKRSNILKMRTFSITDELDPFLKNIDIKGLID